MSKEDRRLWLSGFFAGVGLAMVVYGVAGLIQVLMKA